MIKNRLLTRGIALSILLLLFCVSFIPSIGGINSENELTEIDTHKSSSCLVNNHPPWPPLMWTEDFSTIYLKIPGDPGGGSVYYWIEWGDGHVEEWIGPYESNETVALSYLGSEGQYSIKVAAKNMNGTISKWAVYSLTKSSDFKFFHPTLGYVGITYKFTIYLEGYKYYMFDWGDGTNSGWVTGLANKSFSYPGEYELRWKAKRWKAKDIYGNKTPWSDPILITILTLGNNSPDAPEIDGSRKIKAGVEYEFTSSAVDSDGDNVSFYIEWGDGTSDGWTLYVESETKIKLTHIWSEKVCIFKAKAKDIYGYESDWTEWWFSKNQNVWFLRWLERSPLLQRLLGWYA